GTVPVLHAFPGCADGFFPIAPLVQASDGAFYGMTQSGGTPVGGLAGGGTAFKVTPDGVFTTLHTFPYYSGPAAALVEGTDGRLYGTTQYSGTRVASTGSCCF